MTTLGELHGGILHRSRGSRPGAGLWAWLASRQMKSPPDSGVAILDGARQQQGQLISLVGCSGSAPALMWSRLAAPPSRPGQADLTDGP